MQPSKLSINFSASCFHKINYVNTSIVSKCREILMEAFLRDSFKKIHLHTFMLTKNICKVLICINISARHSSNLSYHSRVELLAARHQCPTTVELFKHLLNCNICVFQNKTIIDFLLLSTLKCPFNFVIF